MNISVPDRFRETILLLKMTRTNPQYQIKIYPEIAQSSPRLAYFLWNNFFIRFLVTYIFVCSLLFGSVTTNVCEKQYDRVWAIHSTESSIHFVMMTNNIHLLVERHTPWSYINPTYIL